MRLVTRMDFDGQACAVLLKALGLVDEVLLTHANDLQKGKVAITENDIIANLPYVEGCHLWFDHHTSEQKRVEEKRPFKGRFEEAPSAARVIYNYYDGAKTLSRFDEMLRYADIADSAQFTNEDILNPKGWILFSFLCDPRTGLAYYDGFRLSHYQFMLEMIDHLLAKSIDEIMELSDVKERVERYFHEDGVFREFLRQNSRVDGEVLIIDTRGVEKIPTGNRFLAYSLFPETNISIRLSVEENHGTVVFSVGHSVMNRSSKVDVGSLMMKYGGGGHKRVGTCQVPAGEADRVLGELVKAIKS